ncbi:MAG: ligase-associated DNA damage response DEXH box helicase [Opitutales bacterium]|nr:ligase-associated DNA damage response DEXH box helicase [Opitutales bacterium]
MKATDGQEQVEEFFKAQKWKAFPFQKKTWKAYSEGKSGLIHAPTGTGKTYAIWAPALIEWINEQQGNRIPKRAPKLRVLWITPLRALVEDTTRSLQELAEGIDLPWHIQSRTGDTKSSMKATQRKKFPSCLVTTPESLSVLLSYPETKEAFSDLKTIVVDEWHELLSSKRGTQTELCLARLRKWNPKLKSWGLSATLGNLDTALTTLTGTNENGLLINGDLKKKFVVQTIIPKDMEKFPWSGHLGGRLVEEVACQIEQAGTTLVFTNVRSQTEYWYHALLSVRPKWKEKIGIHHGSVDRKDRTEVENRLRTGSIKAVVCTSSLDLGVDFSPVEQVIQIGGPKGVARLLQRAGRCGHQPGAVSKVICVPTQAMELVEYAAARDAMEKRKIEDRIPLRAPLDLLAQHLITLALAGGFQEKETLEEIRSAWSYRHLTDEEWSWTLDFIIRGGKTLRAYDQFKRVIVTKGLHHVESKIIGRFHRMSIGTITSDSAITVKFKTGKNLGTIEESFISRIKPKSNFFFAGRLLKLERIRDLTAIVSQAKSGKGIFPVWGGGKSPLSSELTKAVRHQLEKAKDGHYQNKEMKAIAPTLRLQETGSTLPSADQFLIECTDTREGRNWFLYPFAGRLANEGLAALVSFRLSKITPMTLSMSFNDYGFHLCSNTDIDIDQNQWAELFSPDQVVDELLDCMNLSEMSKRQFREVARVAGLIFQGYPGAQKSARQVQASGGLFFDVFTKYDPENLLLTQSRREVLERQLEVNRITEKLQEIKKQKFILNYPKRLTPFAFPLWAESQRTQVSTESWSDRVSQMAKELEKLHER